MTEPTTQRLRPSQFHVGGGYDGEGVVSCPVCVGGSPGAEDVLTAETIGEALEVAQAHIVRFHTSTDPAQCAHPEIGSADDANAGDINCLACGIPMGYDGKPLPPLELRF